VCRQTSPLTALTDPTALQEIFRAGTTTVAALRDAGVEVREAEVATSKPRADVAEVR
jgi:hypothetical protein